MPNNFKFKKTRGFTKWIKKISELPREEFDDKNIQLLYWSNDFLYDLHYDNNWPKWTSDINQYLNNLKFHRAHRDCFGAFLTLWIAYIHYQRGWFGDWQKIYLAEKITQVIDCDYMFSPFPKWHFLVGANRKNLKDCAIGWWHGDFDIEYDDNTLENSYPDIAGSTGIVYGEVDYNNKSNLIQEIRDWNINEHIFIDFFSGRSSEEKRYYEKEEIRHKKCSEINEILNNSGIFRKSDLTFFSYVSYIPGTRYDWTYLDKRQSHTVYLSGKKAKDKVFSILDSNTVNKIKSVLSGKEKQDNNEFTLSLRFDILKRDKYSCQLCGRTAKEDDVKLEIDHKIPRSKGGPDTMDNLWTLCFDCNRGKQDKDL